jgi:hypothetical protein
MKKQDTSFKFVVGKLSDNDPCTRLMIMEGNTIIERLYQTETSNRLLALAECLRALADYANNIAEEYERLA